MESSLFNYLNLINEVHENVAPRTFKEAMKSQDSAEWRKAIYAEIKSLLELGTWEKVKKSDMPPGKKCKTGAFIFKRKYTGDTNIRFKYKARLVAHGYTQSRLLYKNQASIRPNMSRTRFIILEILFKRRLLTSSKSTPKFN